MISAMAPPPLFVPVSGCILPLLLFPPTSFCLSNTFRIDPQYTPVPLWFPLWSWFRETRVVLKLCSLVQQN